MEWTSSCKMHMVFVFVFSSFPILSVSTVSRVCGLAWFWVVFVQVEKRRIKDKKEDDGEHGIGMKKEASHVADEVIGVLSSVSASAYILYVYLYIWVYLFASFFFTLGFFHEPNQNHQSSLLELPLQITLTKLFFRNQKTRRTLTLYPSVLHIRKLYSYTYMSFTFCFSSPSCLLGCYFLFLSTRNREK